MSEDNVKLLLLKYGHLKSFHLVKEKDELRSKGYAFCEFLDDQSTVRAVKELNGLVIESKPLILKLAGTPAPLEGQDSGATTYD
jgi:RNA recognition motif-containing protein